ncbi:MAG TPA: lytic murein transglycosylase B, partial [Burkholderiaceae bacterium]|nr:lytic murein transglycosylase B [Burkholderiaceae bacterium]
KRVVRRRALLFAAWAAACLPAHGQNSTTVPYPERTEVREFIDHLVAGHGFKRAWLEQAFAQARYSEGAERLTTPALAPPSALNWVDYRARNVDDKRIENGLLFWRTHSRTLARAVQHWNVPAEIIVAILGIETQYGRTTGTFRTLDVLLTLSFDYTRRAAFYRDELIQFLLLMREQRLDPLAQRGSFAGALGLPQFMPSSIRRHAVDFDGDGRIDLSGSVADAIGSVANFLSTHGWQADLPVQFLARADAVAHEALRSGIQPAHRWQDVAVHGVMIEHDLPGETKVLLADLPYFTPDGVEAIEYRLGTRNFAALLNYNRSYFYAAAVAELAQELRGRAEPLTPHPAASTAGHR